MKRVRQTFGGKASIWLCRRTRPRVPQSTDTHHQQAAEALLQWDPELERPIYPTKNQTNHQLVLSPSAEEQPDDDDDTDEWSFSNETDDSPHEEENDTVDADDTTDFTPLRSLNTASTRRRPKSVFGRKRPTHLFSTDECLFSSYPRRSVTLKEKDNDDDDDCTHSILTKTTTHASNNNNTNKETDTVVSSESEESTSHPTNHETTTTGVATTTKEPNDKIDNKQTSVFDFDDHDEEDQRSNNNHNHHSTKTSALLLRSPEQAQLAQARAYFTQLDQQSPFPVSSSCHRPSAAVVRTRRKLVSVPPAYQQYQDACHQAHVTPRPLDVFWKHRDDFLPNETTQHGGKGGAVLYEGFFCE